jgi:hypothetical protein
VLVFRFFPISPFPQPQLAPSQCRPPADIRVCSKVQRCTSTLRPPSLRPTIQISPATRPRASPEFKSQKRPGCLQYQAGKPMSDATKLSIFEKAAKLRSRADEEGILARVSLYSENRGQNPHTLSYSNLSSIDLLGKRCRFGLFANDRETR